MGFRNCLAILSTAYGPTTDDIDRLGGTILEILALATAAFASATWVYWVSLAAGKSSSPTFYLM